MLGLWPPEFIVSEPADRRPPAAVVKIQPPFPQASNRKIRPSGQPLRQRCRVNNVGIHSEFRVFAEFVHERQQIGGVAQRVLVDERNVHKDAAPRSVNTPWYMSWYSGKIRSSAKTDSARLRARSPAARLKSGLSLHSFNIAANSPGPSISSTQPPSPTIHSVTGK